MSTLSKRSFSGGELTPALHFRTDLSKYTSGVKTLRNFYVMRHGGATNRPGTKFVGEVSDSSRKVRLLPFVFSNSVSYTLEFGHYYLRIIRDGAHILEAAKTISAVTNADPAVITVTGHGYANGDEVTITGVAGMTELNGRNFKVSNQATNTFELQTMDSVDLDSTSFGTYSSGGSSEKVYTVVTDYIEADLFDLEVIQSVDVVTIAHPDYNPRELQRVTENNWVITSVVTSPSISSPRASVSAGAVGTTTYKYKVTSIKEESFEESIPLNEAAETIGIVTGTSPVVVNTIAAHGYAVGDIVFFNWVKADVLSSNGPISQLNALGRGPFTITVVPIATQFSVAVNTTGSSDTATTSSVERDPVTVHLSDTPTSSAPNVINWTEISGAQEYNVYRELNGIFGLIGISGTDRFNDINVTPDTTTTPPIDNNPFDAFPLVISNITQANPAVLTYTVVDDTENTTENNYINGGSVYIISVNGMTEINNSRYIITNVNTSANTFELQDTDGVGIDSTGFTAYSSGGEIYRTGFYPSTVTYFQQRLTFANTDNDTEKIWASRIGRFKNFTITSPIQADDSLSFNVAGRQINAVKHLLDLGRLVIFTETGEWTAGGDDSGILRPTSINPKQHSYNGSSKLPPLVINNNALYVQARGSYVRDLGFDIQVDGYRGDDLTNFSTHLFEDFTIVDWAYQQIPNSIVWAVRSDGTLLSLTYIREQEIFAWARHDFEGGIVESVSVVPEGTEDVLYVVIKRTINSVVTRYVERLYSRNIVDIVDSKFLDSYLTFDGRNTSTTTMTLSGGTDWTYLEDLTLTASVAFFESTDVGNSIHMKDSTGTLVRCEITAFTSTTVVTIRPHKTVPTTLRSIAVTTWDEAVDQVTGLWHLEGEDVSVFADGFVVANPNNASYDTITVSSGSITLDNPYSVIHVGLPYTSDIETLDIDTPEGETISDKAQHIGKVTIGVEESRGGFVGNSAPNEAVNFLDGLTEIKVRDDENYDDPVDLVSGKMDLNIRPEWNSNGRIFIRQTDPIPFTVLSIHPAGNYPFRG